MAAIATVEAATQRAGNLNDFIDICSRATAPLDLCDIAPVQGSYTSPVLQGRSHASLDDVPNIFVSEICKHAKELIYNADVLNELAKLLRTDAKQDLIVEARQLFLLHALRADSEQVDVNQKRMNILAIITASIKRDSLDNEDLQLCKQAVRFRTCARLHESIFLTRALQDAPRAELLDQRA